MYILPKSVVNYLCRFDVGEGGDRYKIFIQAIISRMEILL
jgi:hypothetical protein